MDSNAGMFEKYFQDWEVKPGLDKEYVSVFEGWLGEQNLHKLDDVTEQEWSRFNTFLRLIARSYSLSSVDMNLRICHPIDDVELILESFEESADKPSDRFIKIILPELDAVYTEEWDFTWILWHRNNGAVEALSQPIKQAGLYHWHDASE